MVPEHVSQSPGEEHGGRAAIAAAVPAAIAEASVACLPLYTVVTGGGGAAIPLPVFAAVLLSGSALAVTLVCRHRQSPRVGTLVAAAAVVAGVLLGRGGMQLEVFTVLVFLLVALRVVALGLRDWREPIGGSFAIGAVALGTEAVIGISGSDDWGPPLLLLIPVFFVGSLTSRAVSAWMSDDAEDLAPDARAGWLRRAVTVAAWLPVAMVGAALLGIRGGMLDRLGSILAPIGNAIVSLLVFVFSQVARPVFWLVDRLGIDPEGVRRLFARVQLATDRARERAQDQIGESSLLGRLLGLALFVLAAWVLIRFLRRLRPETQGSDRRADRGRAAETGTIAAEPERDVMRRTTRRDPPADRVRRWYGEVLAGLARQGVEKDPALTPAEFASDAARAYPDCGVSMEALTRAYEDVRYGSIQIDRAALRTLDGHRRAILAAIRRGAPEP